MTMTFEALKAAALAAEDEVALFKIVQETSEKYWRNVRTAQFMSYTQGRAAEADHYFQNVLPGWYETTKEIQAIFVKAVDGKTTEEIVEIIKKATKQ